MTILQFIQNRLQRRPTEGGYIAQIDGLRFIAIFAVVLQHLSERMLRLSTHTIEKDDFTFFISRGTIGVFLFFAISGFVLALPFAKSLPLSISRLNSRFFCFINRFEVSPTAVVTNDYFFWIQKRIIAQSILSHKFRYTYYSMRFF